MAQEFSAIRQNLSNHVDKEVWGGQRDLKDRLRRHAGGGTISDTYGECLKKAMESGGNVKQAYEQCRRQFQLGKNYRELWGTAKAQRE